MAKKYLQITFADGVIHEYSKTAKEGFEEQPANKKGVVGYKKEYKRGAYGKLKKMTLRDSDFGKQISIELLDKNGETNYLNIPLFDSKKSIAAFAASFITYLPELIIDQDYRFFPYSIDVPNTTYQNKGISIKYAKLAEEEVYEEDQYKIKRLTNTYRKRETGEFFQGDIPEVTYEQGIDGLEKNSKERDRFLYNLLLKYVKDETKKPNPATNATPPQNTAPTPPATPASPQSPPVTPPPAGPPVAPPMQQAPPVGPPQAPPSAPPVQGGLPQPPFQPADDDDDLPF